LIPALLMVGILSVSGQSLRYYAGGKAGFGIPSLAPGSKSTPLREGFGLRLSYYGGLVLEVQSDKWLGFRTEINYSSQGGERNGMQAMLLSNQLKEFWDILTKAGVKHDNYMYVNLKSEEIFNYIEIPLMAKCTFGAGSRFNFYLNSGPLIGILLHTRSITKGVSSIYLDKEGITPVDKYLQLQGKSVLGLQTFNNDSDVTGSTNNLNFGWQGSLGFEVILRSGKIFVDFGGNYGFVPVQKDQANGFNTTDNGIITIGYLVKL
jgi:hypothetical protein